METLSHRDWLKLHEVLLALHDAPTLGDLPTRVLESVRTLIPYESGSIQDDRGGLDKIPWLRGVPWQPAPAAPGEELCGVRMMPAWGPDFLVFREAFFALSAERHPHTDYYRRTGDGAARRVSDIVPMRQLRRTAFYHELCRPQRVNWQLTIYVDLPPHGDTLTLALCRQSPDFSERDRLLLELLRPHLAQAWLRALRFAQQQQQQRVPLRQSAESARLPADGLASARALADGLRLTAREGEVLFWVSEGKTNAETAVILAVSPLTVKTHVEHILAKLGCETRTAAACLAREALHRARRR